MRGLHFNRLLFVHKIIEKPCLRSFFCFLTLFYLKFIKTGQPSYI